MKTKFLIVLSVALLAAEAMLAVTLPSSSYSPYVAGDGAAEYDSYTGVQLPNVSFQMLGTAERTDVCVKADDDYSGDKCVDCCNNYYGDGDTVPGKCADDDWDCWDARSACVDYCRTELSPIEGGEWFMVLLAALLAVTCCIRYLTFNINNKANQ